MLQNLLYLPITLKKLEFSPVKFFSLFWYLWAGKEITHWVGNCNGLDYLQILAWNGQTLYLILHLCQWWRKIWFITLTPGCCWVWLSECGAATERPEKHPLAGSEDDSSLMLIWTMSWSSAILFSMVSAMIGSFGSWSWTVMLLLFIWLTYNKVKAWVKQCRSYVSSNEFFVIFSLSVPAAAARIKHSTLGW